MSSDYRGVLYVATSDEFIEEANSSARSVREVMPDVSIAIVSDRDVKSNVYDFYIELDSPDYGFGDKILAMRQTPFEKTLYLDADTHVQSSVDELFPLLDNFDIAGAIAPFGHQPPSTVHKRRLPNSVNLTDLFPESTAFPMYNTGVILYEDTESVKELLDNWYETYANDNPIGNKHFSDQEAFRRELYDSDLRIATLTAEYNVRFIGRVQGEAKIFHDRQIDENQRERINQSRGRSRVFKRAWNNAYLILSEKDGSGVQKLLLDISNALSNAASYLKYSQKRLSSHFPWNN